jgi:hypothetical protein
MIRRAGMAVDGHGHWQALALASATHHHGPRERGYVLVMTLGLLVLCATLLVTVSRAALRHAGAARAAGQELQRRWGALSCRRAVLPHAEVILATAEAARRRPMPVVATTVRLGDVEFELVVSDEQAKANVNAILANADVPRTETRIRQALGGSGLGNEVRIRATYGAVVVPVVDPRQGGGQAGESFSPTVSGFGQVFEEVPPARLVRRPAGGKFAPADVLTCWGSGAVNARRASDAALSLAGGRSVTQVEINRLIEARERLFHERRVETREGQPPGEQFGALLQATASESVKNKGNLGLVETSACHSLWVVTRNGRREWYDLAVLDRTNRQRPVTFSQSW